MKAPLCAAAVIGVGAMMSPNLAGSAPLRPMMELSVPSGVEKVQHRRGFYRHGGNYYYNGHRGYRYYRPGYRRYGEFWFPGAAFAAGALIGGAIGQAAGAMNYQSSDAHVQWCSQQYRSYDPSSDTYQPYNGPRRPCVSPY